MRIFLQVLLLGVSVGWSCGGLAEIPVPPLNARVIDQTASLSPPQRIALERTLEAFEAHRGTQIVVLMVTSTAPETIEAYALRVAEHWRVGRKKIDDGALLLVAKGDHAVRLEVGYGLEGTLNDAVSKRIISEDILPRFERNDFYGGIVAGLEHILRVASGEVLPTPNPAINEAGANLRQWFPIILLLALVIGTVARRVLGRLPGALFTGALVALIAWSLSGLIFIALMAGVFTLIFTSSGGLVRSGWLLGGGFGAGGGLGGGFGGGGGSFGGGGASGRW